MSTVEFGHRNEIRPHTEVEYLQFSRRLVEMTSDILGIRSIVVCGSLAKGTLVPGWSDLDIIYFFDYVSSPAPAFKRIGNTIKPLQTGAQIPVGVDLFSAEKFQRSLKIGGRPIAMTFEVAGSGCTVYGDKLFEEIKWDDAYGQAVEEDAQRLFAAELHNWRRWFISCDENDEIGALRRKVKTCLKLAKYLSDPSLKAPYSYEQCVNDLRNFDIPTRTVDIYELAVTTRADWMSIANTPEEVRFRNRVFSESLAGHRI